MSDTTERARLIQYAEGIVHAAIYGPEMGWTHPEEEAQGKREAIEVVRALAAELAAAKQDLSVAQTALAIVERQRDEAFDRAASYHRQRADNNATELAAAEKWKTQCEKTEELVGWLVERVPADVFAEAARLFPTVIVARAAAASEGKP